MIKIKIKNLHERAFPEAYDHENWTEMIRISFSTRFWGQKIELKDDKKLKVKKR